jgi:hypothetical protein
MSWKLPKRVPTAGRVISAKDMNEGFLPYVEEFGTLGEHNFNQSMDGQIDRATELAADVGMNLRSTATTANNYPELYNTATGLTYIFPSETWQPIVGLVEEDLVTSGAALYVLGSMQYAFDVNTRNKDGAFLQVAIRLDGAVYANTAVGDQDALSAGQDMELGLSGWGGGVDVDATLPIAPGNHTVEIVARVLVRGNPDASARMEVQIHNRELILIEMR